MFKVGILYTYTTKQKSYKGSNIRGLSLLKPGLNWFDCSRTVCKTADKYCTKHNPRQNTICTTRKNT